MTDHFADLRAANEELVAGWVASADRDDRALIAEETAAEQELCEVHKKPLVMAESGGPETGPTGFYWICLECDRDDKPSCPKCGERENFEVREFPTRNYGGGFDTMEICRECDYLEVYV